jgi:hypothetical protein
MVILKLVHCRRETRGQAPAYPPNFRVIVSKRIVLKPKPCHPEAHRGVRSDFSEDLEVTRGTNYPAVALILISTPAGRLSLFSASIVLAVA